MGEYWGMPNTVIRQGSQSSFFMAYLVRGDSATLMTR
jgi:hypothetical protein